MRPVCARCKWIAQQKPLDGHTTLPATGALSRLFIRLADIAPPRYEESDASDVEDDEEDSEEDEEAEPAEGTVTLNPLPKDLANA